MTVRKPHKSLSLKAILVSQTPFARLLRRLREIAWNRGGGGIGSIQRTPISDKYARLTICGPDRQRPIDVIAPLSAPGPECATLALANSALALPGLAFMCTRQLRRDL